MTEQDKRVVRFSGETYPSDIIVCEELPLVNDHHLVVVNPLKTCTLRIYGEALRTDDEDNVVLQETVVWWNTLPEEQIPECLRDWVRKTGGPMRVRQYLKEICRKKRAK